MLSMDYYDWVVVDEAGDTYGVYGSRTAAERAIEELYDSPFVSKDTIFSIEIA